MSDVDQTGRSKLGRSVLTSWGSQLVMIAFGFIMPRMIDEELGQTTLGIWDFGWSIVSYLGLAMMGIGSSVNRYVARYHASGESDKLSRTISSVFALQALIGLSVAVATLILAELIPFWMSERLGDQGREAGQVLLFLGLALSIQMGFDVYRGLLTGYHQWSVYNALNAGGHALTSISMLVVLVNGYGLVGMAQTYLAMTLGIELYRRFLARRLCPNIEFRREHINRHDMRKVFKFGVKTILLYMPRVMVQQTVMMFVFANLGPSLLAVLARPAALINHATVFANKFGYVLTPTAGSLQGGGRSNELKQFAMTTMRAGWILAVLPLVYLLMLGDHLIELWMGNGYANLPVMAILAAGSILPVSQSATLNILTGMNEHGRVAKINIIFALISMLIGIAIVSQVGWTLVNAAILIILPSSIGLGLGTIVIGCRVLKIGGREYFLQVMRDPLLIGITSAFALYLVRQFGPEQAFPILLLGTGVHGAVAFLFLRHDLRNVIRAL